uniref:addiction module toxin RelE n=1 Tax=Prevotella sp. TaxID=59823 RepID=UPI0040277178
MKVEFYVEDEFLAQSKRLSKKYHSLKSDLKLFRKSLEEDPFQGSNLGKGVKKVRMAIANKGKDKSGGARIITYNIQNIDDDTIKIDLLTIYDKGEISTISDNFINYLLDNRSNMR